MKKGIIISMDHGFIEATELDGMKFLGKLEINTESHSNFMPANQIENFLDSVVLPQLDLYSREIETEAIEKEEIALETQVGPAP